MRGDLPRHHTGALQRERCSVLAAGRCARFSMPIIIPAAGSGPEGDHKMLSSRFLSAASLCLAVALALAAPAAADPPEAVDMSLEDLLNVEITSAARKSQRLNDVAAAVYVITREDIERSGATSIPEALRLAPGVSVARLANNRWAVSIRGFNSRFSNKLLVLMDGRSMYSQLFSGVLWQVEDTLLEDIDRIEVIPRVGRGDVGGERGQRRDQHHHAAGSRYPGEPAGRRCRQRGKRLRLVSPRRDGRRWPLPRLGQGLRA